MTERQRFMRMTYAIVRSDTPPTRWWDGYYSRKVLAKAMAKYWIEELGVRCHAIRASYPGLPESGFHVVRRRKR
jgi:hypothetical protein